MKTFLVTGNFGGKIQDFFLLLLFGLGAQREGERGNESSSSASRERGSGYVLFVIQMTHMELIEPLEREDYKFKQEGVDKSRPQVPPLHPHIHKHTFPRPLH